MQEQGAGSILPDTAPIPRMKRRDWIVRKEMASQCARNLLRLAEGGGRLLNYVGHVTFEKVP